MDLHMTIGLSPVGTLLSSAANHLVEFGQLIDEQGRAEAAAGERRNERWTTQQVALHG
jgi:hypothetical protein